MRLRWWFVMVATGCLVVIMIWKAGTSLDEYARFESPDGRYVVVVMRREVWPAVAPGQSGDAPGVVQLMDRQGRLLEEAEIDMVQRVDRVYWEGNRVSIKLVADWSLPE